MISIVVPPHETADAREQRQQQQQQRQQQQGQPGLQQVDSGSSSPEGADRAVPSIDHNAEMQHADTDEQGDAAKQQGDAAAERVRIFPVRWGRIRDALHWLKANNPFYEDIEIRIPEGPDLQPDAGEFNNPDVHQMQHYLVTDNQPQLQRDALDSALGGAHSARQDSGGPGQQAAVLGLYWSD